MHVLITGASGLVGEAICNYFINKNCKVTAIVFHQNLNINHQNLNELKLDLTDCTLQLCYENYDAVIHCAAIIANKDITNDELFLVNQNIDQLIFTFCKKHDVKLIYFSTAYLYDYNDNHTLNELSKVNESLEGYYLSKLTSEQQLEKLKLNAVIFRLSSPYGNFIKQNNVMKLFINKMENNENITLMGKGKRLQNFIYTEDIAEVCWLSVLKKITGVYNLSYNKPYSMLELANTIKKIIKSNSTIQFDELKKDSLCNVNFSNNKIKTILNWEPKYNLEIGIQKTLLN